MKKKILVLLLATLMPNSVYLARAQQPPKIAQIGYLTTASAKVSTNELEAFRQGLRELGYVEGKNIAIEYRYAEGKLDRFPQHAEELFRFKVEIIVANSTPAVQAAKNATGDTVPIVMTGSADPVASGFVASLARPGGNITGLSLRAPELAGKRMELLRELLPKLSRVAFLARKGDTAYELFLEEAQDAAEKFGMKFQPLVIGGPEEFEIAFSAMIKERAGALIVQPIFNTYSERIANLAARNRLPTMSDALQFAESGGLMRYGPDRLAMFRRAAVYVDKILKGAKPADLPVERPMKFQLEINLKTAKQIGLTIPGSILYRADRVIKDAPG